MRYRFLPLVSLTLALIAGCSLDRTGIGSGSGDSGPGIDATIDAGDAGEIDSGMILLDGGIDGGLDGGPCGACAAPGICCAGVCVDPRADVMHCGGCSACASGPHSTPMCASSTCSLVCDAGFDDCDGVAANGCETDLSSPSSCGSCGNVCASGPNSTPSCGGTGCGLVCAGGFADCNAVAADGCEIDIRTPSACGSCGNVCASGPNATAICDGTSCGLSCSPGFDDCDGMAANGCEADLSSAAACGACGSVCAGSRACVSLACIGWAPLATTGAPPARYDHTAVWTGTEMIVWGGQSGATTRNDGYAYDPATDTWRAITTTGAPQARRGHTAIWTGTEMVVWGGYSTSAGFLADGGAYDPATDTWRAISGTGAPGARSRVPGVWTGGAMLIWGGWTTGGGVINDGDRWRASTDAWSSISTSGRPSARRWNAAVWTGTEMLVWSGEDGGGATRGDGFAYTPGSDSWRGISNSGDPAGRARMSFVWASGIATPVMIVWGGDGGSGGGDVANASVRADGGRYDPAGDAWSGMAAAPIGARAMAPAVWTGTEMLVWGGEGATGVYGDGAGYDPVANVWTTMRPAGSPVARSRHTAVWTGTEMIVFGGVDGAFTALGSGGRYAP